MRPFLFIALLFFTFSKEGFSENYIGMTTQSEYEAVEVELPMPDKKSTGQQQTAAQKETAQDKAYKGKIDKIDNWTKTAYGLLNDGSQEKYIKGLEDAYKQQLELIRSGSTQKLPEYEKFKEKVMPKVEND